MSNDALIIGIAGTLKLLFAILCGCYGSLRIMRTQSTAERLFAMLVVMVSWIFLRTTP